MIINKIINKTNFFYTDEYESTNLGEYYNHILSILEKNFVDEEVPYEVNFGISDLKKKINLDFQYEHTIIKNKNEYSYKIYRYDYLNQMDCIFEYSNANINFLSKFNELITYINKNIYIPPLIYDEYSISNTNNRINNFITIQNWSKRRGDFFNKFNHDNITNTFDKNLIRESLNNYKILINIHQIDEHLTFEELRVLPALCTGILVISEDIPFKEYIPYHNHIIWSSYENLEKTCKDVLNNYEYYREKKLNGFSDTIKKMKETSQNKIKFFFKNYDTFYNTSL